MSCRAVEHFAFPMIVALCILHSGCFFSASLNTMDALVGPPFAESDDALRMLNDEMQKYDGKNIWKLDHESQARLSIVLDRLRAKEFWPAFLAKIADGPEIDEFLLVQTGPGFYATDEMAAVRIYIICAGGISGPIEFSVGWQLGLGNFQLSRDIKGIENVLVITLDTRNGYFLREYYAIPERENGSVSEKDIVLIRLEYPIGVLVANNFMTKYDHFRIGPMPERRSPEWRLRDLESGSKTRILESLLWISSLHDFQDKDISELRSQAMQLGVLERLAESEDEWIREAAEMTLEVCKATEPKNAEDVGVIIQRELAEGETGGCVGPGRFGERKTDEKSE